uniref:Radial spoke head 3 n=1 Tax=Takifugu rubripes TaxID=31033 RepID=A0A3B5KGX8_TAKRU
QMAFVPYNQKDQHGSYTFSSRPRPVEIRSKYRKPPAEQTPFLYGNIMYDRRVVRGNTYAQNIIPTVPFHKQAREHVRSLTPEAVQGRTHIDVQTELYLEELSDVIASSDMDCQTDAFLDKPATPLFIPAKTGKDVGTQVEEGELFDFDREVQPLLEVLVGKVIEQSLKEVMEEEELATLKDQQQAFEELRNYQLAEVQRLQEHERRRREEKEHRIAQQREVLKKEGETVQKIAARAYAQQYLSGLLPSVLTSLRTNGYFHDPVERDIESSFLPWLMSEVDNCLEKRNAARQLLDSKTQHILTFDSIKMQLLFQYGRYSVEHC